MMLSPQSSFRLAVVAFAAVLSAAAGWGLAGELPVAFAADNACQAAALARLRGDLWAACAQIGSPEDAGRAAERAVRLAPHQAAAWLTLARLLPPGANPTECLKIAYYVAPNEAALMPRRLMVAVSPGMLADRDVGEMMRHDVRNIMTRHRELAPAIIAAHRAAAPEGRAALEAASREVDAGFADALRRGGQ
jgi:hypothetical protein